MDVLADEEEHLVHAQDVDAGPFARHGRPEGGEEGDDGCGGEDGDKVGEVGGEALLGEGAVGEPHACLTKGGVSL